MFVFTEFMFARMELNVNLQEFLLSSLEKRILKEKFQSPYFFTNLLMQKAA